VSSVPFANEIGVLLRAINVLYTQSTEQRRKKLRRVRTGHGLDSAIETAFVDIDRSPAEVATKYFTEHRHDDLRSRASSALEKLRAKEPRDAVWKALAAANVKVPTTLRSLCPIVAARLLRHGYALTMVQMHVLFDEPAREPPSEAEALLLLDPRA
jgi:hypothetical protein